MQKHVGVPVVVGATPSVRLRLPCRFSRGDAAVLAAAGEDAQRQHGAGSSIATQRGTPAEVADAQAGWTTVPHCVGLA
jgi:hypothetical protein